MVGCQMIVTVSSAVQTSRFQSMALHHVLPVNVIVEVQSILPIGSCSLQIILRCRLWLKEATMFEVHCFPLQKIFLCMYVQSCCTGLCNEEAAIDSQFPVCCGFKGTVGSVNVIVELLDT